MIRGAARRLRKLRRSEYGGAMVELAVILPVLILFAVGAMDYGRVFFRSIMVANAARAGAEWGAYDVTNAGDQSGTQAFSKLDAQEITALQVSSQRVCRCNDTVVNCAATCTGYGAPRLYVEVTAIDSVTMLLKYPGLPAKVGISRTATFRGPQ